MGKVMNNCWYGSVHGTLIIVGNQFWEYDKRTCSLQLSLLVGSSNSTTNNKIKII